MRGAAAWLLGFGVALDVSRQDLFVGDGAGHARSGMKEERSGAGPLPGAEGHALEQCGFGPGALGPEAAAAWRDYAALHVRERAKGCAGRYLVHSVRAHDNRGLSDNIRGATSMLYFAMASKRALLLNWEKYGMQAGSFGALFEPHHVDWSVPAGCAQLLDARRTEYDWDPAITEIFHHDDGGDLFGDEPALVSASSLWLPRFWQPAFRGGAPPALKALLATAKQPVGCGFLFLFQLSAKLLDEYQAVVTDLGGAPSAVVHWRTDTRHFASPDGVETVDASAPALQAFASCLAHGARPLRCPAAAPSDAGGVWFFSESPELKGVARAAGLRTTGLRPYDTSDGTDAARQLETVAELLAMSTARTIASIPPNRNSGFPRIAAELAAVRYGDVLEAQASVAADGYHVCEKPMQCRPTRAINRVECDHKFNQMDCHRTCPGYCSDADFAAFLLPKNETATW